MADKKHDKHEENLLERTAHSIRDKVHELTDEVKEKAHHLKHGDDSKKTHPAKNSAGSSDDEKDKSANPPSSSKPTDTDSASKSTTLPSADEHKDTAAAPPSTGDNKDTASAPSSSGLPGGDSKPSNEKQDDNAHADLETPGETNKDEKTTAAKPPGEDKNQEEKSSDTAPAVENSNDRIHVSFDGVNTVDDLLERIDDSVEKAKIIVGDDKKKTEGETPTKPDDEPIRISYDKVHKLEDLLALVNDQPGHRKVVLEGAPDQSNTVSLQKSTPSTNNTEKKPEASSAQPDQIHVNIENIRSVDELLDRIDDAVQHVPIVIETTHQSTENKPKKDVEASLKFQKEIPESNEKFDKF